MVLLQCVFLLVAHGENVRCWNNHCALSSKRSRLSQALHGVVALSDVIPFYLCWASRFFTTTVKWEMHSFCFHISEHPGSRTGCFKKFDPKGVACVLTVIQKKKKNHNQINLITFHLHGRGQKVPCYKILSAITDFFHPCCRASGGCVSLNIWLPFWAYRKKGYASLHECWA